MSDEPSLDDLLNDETEIAGVDPEPTEEPAEPEVKAEGGAEEGSEDPPKVEEEAEPEDKPTEVAASEQSKEIAGLLHTAMAERDKRQKAESVLNDPEALAARLKELNKSSGVEADTYFENPPDAINAALQNMQAQFDQKLAATRADLSEATMRMVQPDYDEVVKDMRAAVLEGRRPDISAALAQSESPAAVLYQKAKAEKALAEIGDVDQLKAKMEAELRAKIEAELAAKAEKGAAEVADIPEPLAGAKGAASPSRDTWTGPPTTEELFG